MGDSAKTTRMRFLVIGCGSIGRRHIQNLRILGAQEIVAFDICRERADQVGKELGVETVERLEDGWERRPEVVVIATPPSLHVSLAKKAALEGSHLFIEKPLSNRWDGVDGLLQVVRESNLVTLVGCNMRFHPGLTTVKNLVNRRAIGTIVAARVEVGHYLPDWHPWEDYRNSYSARSDLGGGIILDAIHEIDYIRWLLGEVAEATCMAGKLSRLEIDTEDLAAILLRFESGAVGEVHLDYIQRAYSRTCQIIGEEGTIHWDYTAGQVRWYSARDQRWKVFSNPADWQPNQMYVDELKHFFGCVTGEEKPALDVFEAARVLQVALAAKESARHRRWVELGSHHWHNTIS